MTLTFSPKPLKVLIAVVAGRNTDKGEVGGSSPPRPTIKIRSGPETWALEATAELIDGYESPLGMELLGTVDWLVHEGGYATDLGSIREGIARWPGGKKSIQRKQRLFDDRLLQLALNRLKMASSIREAAPLAV